VELTVLLAVDVVASAVAAADATGEEMGGEFSAAMAMATLSGPIFILSRCIPTMGATGSWQI